MKVWLPLNKEKLKETDFSLFLGKYRIRIDPLFIPKPLIPSVVKFIKENIPKEKSILGKQVVLEDIFQINGHLVLEINILENPIPILAILGAFGFLIGGFLLWRIVIEVRKLITLDGIVKNPLFPIILVSTVFIFGIVLMGKIKK